MFCLLLFKAQVVFADSVPIVNAAKIEQDAGHFTRALEIIDQLELSEQSHSSTLLKGNILYRLGEFSLAEKEYAKSASLASNPKEKAISLYNRGNALLQTGKLKEAKDDYELALRDRPNDLEIENNLKYVKKLLEDPPTEDQNDKNEKNPKVDQKTDADKQKSENQSNESKNENDDKDKNKDKNLEAQSKPNNNESDNEDKDSQDSRENGPQANPEKHNKSAEQNKDDKSSPKESGAPSSSSNEQRELPKTSEESENKKETPSNVDNKENSQGDSNKDKPTNEARSASNELDQEKSSKALNDQILSQLDSLEEDTSSRQKYRYQKGLKDLEADSNQKNMPKRDW